MKTVWRRPASASSIWKKSWIWARTPAILLVIFLELQPYDLIRSDIIAAVKMKLMFDGYGKIIMLTWITFVLLTYCSYRPVFSFNFHQAPQICTPTCLWFQILLTTHCYTVTRSLFYLPFSHKFQDVNSESLMTNQQLYIDPCSWADWRRIISVAKHSYV